MKRVAMRVGGILVPAFAVLTGCSAGVGSEDPGVGTTREATAGRATDELIELQLPKANLELAAKWEVPRLHFGTTGSAGPVCSLSDVEGRAIGLQVGAGLAVVGLGAAIGAEANVVVSDTGPLPASGGINRANLLTASVPGVLTAGVVEASTASSGEAAVSLASVAGIALRVGDVSIAASVLGSHAVALCGAGGAAIAGSGNIAGLAIDGKGIAVTGKPNQTILVGTVRIIINEVIEASTSADSGSIRVAALHVIVPGIADVVVSQADAGVTCSCPTPPPPPPVVSPPACTVSTDCAAGNICFQGVCTSQGST